MRTAAERLLAVLLSTAVLVVGAGLPARAAGGPVNVDMEQLHSRLFSAYVRNYDRGLQGLKDLVLTDNLMYWRQQHPTATSDETVRHMALVQQQLDAKLTGYDPGKAGYDAFIKVMEAMSGIPEVNIATPALKALAEVTLADSAAKWQNLADAVTSSRTTLTWMNKYFALQDQVWGELQRRSGTDTTMAAAWDGYVGSRLNVTVTASVEQLSADPALANWLTLQTILENQNNTDTYITEMRRQVAAAFGQLDAKTDQLSTDLRQLSDKYPVGVDGTRPTADEQAAQKKKSEDFQAQIEAAGSAVYILSTLAGFADAKFGRDVALAGNAAVTIASAINKYLPTVAGLALGQALTSASTLVLTGNVLGAVMSLLPLFTGESASPDQLIMDEIGKLREDVANLGQQMNDRFDRIEKALTQVYADVMTQFDRLFQDIAIVRADLADIEHRIFLLDDKIDTFAAATQAALTAVATQDVRNNINRYVNYRDTYGQDIPTYQEYTTPENSFHFTATALSSDDTFLVPAGTYGAADPVTTLANHRPAGSINYLAWLARQRFDGAFPQPAGKVANPGVWELGARSYAVLEAQNQPYAVKVSPTRAAQIQATGQDINRAAATFSKPTADGKTNALFTALTANYRTAANGLSDQLARIRTAEVQEGKSYDLFGTADQARRPEWPVPATPAEGTCSTTQGPTASRPKPSNVTNNDLASPYLLANYLAPDGAKPTFSWSCNAVVSLTDQSYDDDGVLHNYYTVTLTYRNYVTWPGESTRRPIRTRTFTDDPFESTELGMATLNHNWGWFMDRFEQFATSTDEDTTLADAKVRTQNALNGRQKLYYDTVASRSAGSGDLSAANARVTEAVTLLQAYTELGWARALQQDDLLNGLLNGRLHLPADLPGTAHVTDAFRTASAAYQGCNPATGGGPCTTAGPFDPYRGQSQYTAGCAIDSGPLPGDPVGNCLLSVSRKRTDALAQRYAVHSAELAAGSYTEGLPAVDALMTTVKVTDLAVRT
ncbi:hypothetical protein ACFV1L_08215 [Kitasatospora sp. NPDC059646]|uniref:hypothetical protein n=1 Tax=Kitasatospora sp. NPDC059646 TaxID=3346893 RepID=UPI0036AC91B1